MDIDMPKYYYVKINNGENEVKTEAFCVKQNKINYTPCVSVIIPFHNCVNYIDKCLSSIKNQSLKNIEMICINDGSTDGSLEKVKTHAKNDARITIMSQKNYNAGVARNVGLCVAKGEYISFIDADDFIEHDMFEELYNHSRKYMTEITICNLFLYDEINKVDKKVDWTLKANKANKIVFNYKDIPSEIFTLTNCWVWNRLYNANFLKKCNVKFQSLQSANDTYFSCITLAMASRISCLNKRLIHYRTNRVVQNSTTSNQTKEKSPTDMLKCFLKIYEKLNEINIYEAVKLSFLNVSISHIHWFRAGLCKNSVSSNQFDEFLVQNFIFLFAHQPTNMDRQIEKKFNILRNIFIDAGVIKEIPKRIFYVWGVGEEKSPKVKKCMQTWDEKLHGYEIIEINESSQFYFNFKKELAENKWFRTVYDRKMWAFISDYIRIKVLHKNGGVYFDTDVSVVRDIEFVLSENSFVGIQSSSLDGRADWVEPAVCGCQKGNIFFQRVLSFYDKQIWQNDIYTMPQIFDFFLKKFDIFPFPPKKEQVVIQTSEITIYPEKYFIPYRFREEFNEQCITDNTYTIHWWGASWPTPENILFLKYKSILEYQDSYSIDKLNPFVSVIVCCYNSEFFLRECIESVLNQTLNNIEIICVNDGSTDCTLSILKNFAESDRRITIIDQYNQGLAQSRNNALKVARGKYIQFLDSDDWMRQDALEYLYLYSNYHDLDMTLLGGINFNEESKKYEINNYYSFIYLPKKFPEIFNHEQCKDFIVRMAVSSCLTFYKKSFLDTNKILWINKRVCYEDNLFFTESLLKAKKISIIKDKLYFRRIHSSSITQQKEKNFKDYMKITSFVLQKVKEVEPTLYEKYKDAYLSRCANIYNSLSSEYKAIYSSSIIRLFKEYDASKIALVNCFNFQHEPYFLRKISKYYVQQELERFTEKHKNIIKKINETTSCVKIKLCNFNNTKCYDIFSDSHIISKISNNTNFDTVNARDNFCKFSIVFSDNCSGYMKIYKNIFKYNTTDLSRKLNCLEIETNCSTSKNFKLSYDDDLCRAYKIDAKHGDIIEVKISFKDNYFSADNLKADILNKLNFEFMTANLNKITFLLKNSILLE